MPPSQDLAPLTAIVNLWNHILRIVIPQHPTNCLQASQPALIFWALPSATQSVMPPAPRVQAAQFEENSSLDSITIPQGPRLGNEVIHLDSVCKSYGDRLLMDQVNLDIPAGSVVGELC